MILHLPTEILFIPHIMGVPFRAWQTFRRPTQAICSWLALANPQRSMATPNCRWAMAITAFMPTWANTLIRLSDCDQWRHHYKRNRRSVALWSILCHTARPDGFGDDAGPRHWRTGHLHGLCHLAQRDANHDGVMDTSFSGPDNTSQEKPMEFWVNDGDDTQGGVDVENDRGGSTNYMDAQIDWQRDLENFGRLWICGVPSSRLPKAIPSRCGGILSVARPPSICSAQSKPTAASAT